MYLSEQSITFEDLMSAHNESMKYRFWLMKLYGTKLLVSRSYYLS